MSHRVHSQGKVPFSWEKKPGVCKQVLASEEVEQSPVKLPPPPCPLPESGCRAPFHDLQVPLPPCAFQPPSRSCSKKGIKKNDDPFLTAYKECTKSSRKGKSRSAGGRSRGGGLSGLMKTMSIFSCKQSSSVRDDSLVRVSQLPISRSERETDRWGL
ncbi:hypothetical protein NMG60_11016565 [Bertholletia excelsa]